MAAVVGSRPVSLSWVDGQGCRSWRDRPPPPPPTHVLPVALWNWFAREALGGSLPRIDIGREWSHA